MKVKLKYFAHLREIVGKFEETINLPEDATVKNLLEVLSETYGVAFRDYVYEKGGSEPSPNLNFLLDGRNIMMLDGMETRLYDGCVFVIIPPVGGGV
ncbi:MAG: MoaD family protein [Candidatus Bathyarchaeia archaeon]|nr:MoaD family protein [Candidatus Bathyarchaeota archaeon]